MDSLFGNNAHQDWVANSFIGSYVTNNTWPGYVGSYIQLFEL